MTKIDALHVLLNRVRALAQDTNPLLRSWAKDALMQYEEALAADGADDLAVMLSDYVVALAKANRMTSAVPEREVHVYSARFVEAVAAAVHAANRLYCKIVGDPTLPPWAEAPEWQRDPVIIGVIAVLTGDVTTPQQAHEKWLETKRADGWTYGPVKDPEKRQHPCMVPYGQLAQSQRAKDQIFYVVASSFVGRGDAR